MFAAIGITIVILSVLGGFAVAGGKLLALFHVSEIMVVCGAAIGTMIVSAPAATLKALLTDLTGLLRPAPFDRALHLESLKLLFELFSTAQRDGLVTIESHVEAPYESAIFQKYPLVLDHRHAVEFLCDSLRLVLMGNVMAHDLDFLLESDIDVRHEQDSRTVKVLQRVSDTLPGIGIVAAVLGIVVTMGSINGPVERVGEHVASALTGTFLGVLLAYGFSGPLANALENTKDAETRYLHFLRAGIVSVAKGASPLISVEFARRAIDTRLRPSFSDMEQACQSLKRRASDSADSVAKAA